MRNFPSFRLNACSCPTDCCGTKERLQSTSIYKRLLYAIGALLLSSGIQACGGDGGSSAPPSAKDIEYSIGGSIIGMGNIGRQLILTLNDNHDLILTQNGDFTFLDKIKANYAYSVSIKSQPAFTACTLAGEQGIADQNVANIVVTCTDTDIGVNSQPTGKLNDTGTDWCFHDLEGGPLGIRNVICEAIDWVGNLWGLQQDAYFGRDADLRRGQLVKIGSGMGSFDFTRLASDGKPLAIQTNKWGSADDGTDSGNEADATMWDCVRDNVTGLVWEVKRNNPTHPRHLNHSYTWFNPDPATNGGDAGIELNNTCLGTANTLKCNTTAYVAAINQIGLCGKHDWRLPTTEELRSLAYIGTLEGNYIDIPLIDRTHFPNTMADAYWTSNPYFFFKTDAFVIDFSFAGEEAIKKSENRFLRLVRSN